MVAIIFIIYKLNINKVANYKSIKLCEAELLFGLMSLSIKNEVASSRWGLGGRVYFEENIYSRSQILLN